VHVAGVCVLQCTPKQREGARCAQTGALIASQWHMGAGAVVMWWRKATTVGRRKLKRQLVAGAARWRVATIWRVHVCVCTENSTARMKARKKNARGVNTGDMHQLCHHNGAVTTGQSHLGGEEGKMHAFRWT